MRQQRRYRARCPAGSDGARPLTAGMVGGTCFAAAARTGAKGVCRCRYGVHSSATPFAPPRKCTISRTLDAARSRSRSRPCIGIRSGESCARCAIRSAALVGREGLGCGGSRSPRRTVFPRRHTEIIGEFTTWPILPILQTMFRPGKVGEMTAILAGFRAAGCPARGSLRGRSGGTESRTARGATLPVPPLAQTSSSDCSAGRAVDWQDGPSKRIT